MLHVFAQRKPTSQGQKDCIILVVTMTDPNPWNGLQWIWHGPILPDLSNSSWTFLSIILWWGTQYRLEQLLHGFEVMCFTLTVTIKGLGLVGVGGWINNAQVSRELSVNMKVSATVLCQYKAGICFKWSTKPQQAINEHPEHCTEKELTFLCSL